ncbi:MAG: alpha-glucan family phosphorylase [Deltaproteobacteria bacterium]|nr:alpha-glucan family phosphorylase [Deltaproteobacteria bacterium]MBI2228752.1 alpha-glucan family phosphorylase [Deltaproteobacteria bacterium]MBI2363670.1 alpha-glucan family phosphorylase [Deltaproteobacteria bacterium]
MNQIVSYPNSATVAYFSMDVAIDSGIPTYSGGLGILAGDMLRSAADLGVPLVAVTLAHRKGYFDQRLDAKGNQVESPSKWSPESRLELLAPRISLSIEGREVGVRAWQYYFHGIGGHVVPLLFLDTDLEENDPRDRVLTDHLYGGDEHYRLCQEAVLGFGGVAMLRALGHWGLRVFHMNEGHSALITLALLEEQFGTRQARAISQKEVEAVRRQCVFTTHTPVAAGHDRFPSGLVHQVLGEARAAALSQMRVMNSELNMTELALRLSGFVNGVSMRHGEVSRNLFPGYDVGAITNGVHAVAWTAASFCALFDRALPEWRRDNCYLRYAVGIPPAEIRLAHAQAKKDLLQQVRWLTGAQLDEKAFTLGFARRATAYKRADLLFTDVEKLKEIARRAGPLQLIYAGKAHPRDEGGKAIIRRIFEAAAALANEVRVVYLENYDMALGKLICSGVDIWLNTPLRPHEASGTSGMKAALNGVPSLSVLDGWWIEGHIEGVTGWSIGDRDGAENDSAAEARSLYEKLEQVIVPLFYNQPDSYAKVMRSAIAMNGSFFNTQRMISQYIRNAYTCASGNGAQPLT